jgi:hypothetical protein
VQPEPLTAVFTHLAHHLAVGAIEEPHLIVRHVAATRKGLPSACRRLSCWRNGQEDTFDADYGRLLDRAYTATTDRVDKPRRGKGVASPAESNPISENTSKSGKGLASPMPASWNQIVIWLRQIDGLCQAA